MTTWYVTVCVLETLEVQADTREQAEATALQDFDATANEPEVHDSWEKDA